MSAWPPNNGDPLAKSALARAGTYLGHAIADFLHLYNPQVIILGGGVSRSGALIMEPLRAAMADRVISPEYLHGLVITTAALGDDAGLDGGARPGPNGRMNAQLCCLRVEFHSYDLLH